MRTVLLLFPALLLLVEAAAQPVPPQSRQLVVVTTADWDAPTGHMQRYTRENETSAWEPVGGAVEVVVGQHGLGWGRGLHAGPSVGPVKREGDGKAPAGVFRLGPVFGYAAPDERTDGAMPYLHARPGIQCVDDPASRHYNRIVDSAAVAEIDWNSHEQMRRRDDLYRVGIVVDHNPAPAAPGAGSCIFLHIRSGPAIPTIGCTAMTEPEVEALARWLAAAAAPVLVQLPAEVYEGVRAGWHLP